jgi:hypothetical protein
MEIVINYIYKRTALRISELDSEIRLSDHPEQAAIKGAEISRLLKTHDVSNSLRKALRALLRG